MPAPSVPDDAGDSDLSIATPTLNDDAGASLFASDVRASTDAAGPASSLRALDWFTFFIADIQTGFGPFVAVYLTAHSWTQVDIGLVLTTGSLVALAGQMPGGALVDAVRSARLLAASAVVAIGVSALALALWPSFTVVAASRALHAAASCVLGPALVALSLGLVGYAALGERIGRNARFASIGSGLAAAALGLSGQFLSGQAVFFITAAMTLPALYALHKIRTAAPIHRGTASGGTGGLRAIASGLLTLARDRRLWIFGLCVVLFQLANAAMLPTMASLLAMQSSAWAASTVAACMVASQLVVAALAPWSGRKAQRWGRRPLLMLCFGALVLRGVLFAFISDPTLVVAVQLLDGLSGAIFGVLLPVIVADIAAPGGRFNLMLGVIGSAIGIGASISTTLAGYLLDHAGKSFTFVALAAVAMLALLVIALFMPETRPQEPRAA